MMTGLPESKKKIMRKSVVIFIWIIWAACNGDTGNNPPAGQANEFRAGSFGYDLQFLKEYQHNLVVLGKEGGAQVVISPDYQGRVMTSSANGMQGLSFGWINYDLISSQKPAEHMNAVGGEERFWLGPEGGQFSIYFKKGSEFTFENWFVPKEIDSEPFELVSSSDTAADFRKQMQLENYSGTRFDLVVDRRIRLLDRASINKVLGMELPEDVDAVSFESQNTLTNIGDHSWDKNTGMLSIWILSMMNASDQTTVAIPYKRGDSLQLGKVLTDDYFGKVPADRLKVEDRIILFKADGNYRSKIGISPQRAMPVAASYDAVNEVLTIAQFNLPEGVTGYVNSLWKLQEDPFSGDAINSYNDGAVDGSQMGKFYEIESSSPAASLAPGQTIQHWHRTFHIRGSKEQLDQIARKILGISIDEIKL